jgi:hypothetical protein
MYDSGPKMSERISFVMKIYSEHVYNGRTDEINLSTIKKSVAPNHRILLVLRVSYIKHLTHYDLSFSFYCTR